MATGSVTTRGDGISRATVDSSSPMGAESMGILGGGADARRADSTGRDAAAGGALAGAPTVPSVPTDETHTLNSSDTSRSSFQSVMPSRHT